MKSKALLSLVFTAFLLSSCSYNSSKNKSESEDWEKGTNIELDYVDFFNEEIIRDDNQKKTINENIDSSVKAANKCIRKYRSEGLINGYSWLYSVSECKKYENNAVKTEEELKNHVEDKVDQTIENIKSSYTSVVWKEEDGRSFRYSKKDDLDPIIRETGTLDVISLDFINDIATSNFDNYYRTQNGYLIERSNKYETRYETSVTETSTEKREKITINYYQQILYLDDNLRILNCSILREIKTNEIEYNWYDNLTTQSCSKTILSLEYGTYGILDINPYRN